MMSHSGVADVVRGQTRSKTIHEKACFSLVSVESVSPSRGSVSYKNSTRLRSFIRIERAAHVLVTSLEMLLSSGDQLVSGGAAAAGGFKLPPPSTFAFNPAPDATCVQ